MMNIKLGAFLVFGFAIAAIIQTIGNFKKDKLTTRLLFLWLSIWSSIGFFALFPQFLDYIMKYLNFGNRLFFLTTAAVLILFVIIFYLSSNMAKLNHKVSKLVQEIAILKFKQEEQLKAGISTDYKNEETETNKK